MATRTDVIEFATLIVSSRCPPFYAGGPNQPFCGEYGNDATSGDLQCPEQLAERTAAPGGPLAPAPSSSDPGHDRLLHGP